MSTLRSMLDSGEVRMPQRDIKKAFADAAEIAKLVPENLQEIAFKRALDELLGTGGGSDSGDRASRKRRGGSKKAKRSRGKELDATDDTAALESLDRTKHPEVGDDTDTLTRSLQLLKIAKDEFGLDGLTAAVIAKVLTETFRIKTARTSVITALDAAKRHVNRVKRGGSAVVYHIMAAGEKFLTTPEAQKAEPKRPSKRKARKSAKKVAAKKTKKATKKSGKKATRRGARSWTLVRKLVDDGFFKEPRTIGAIREHLKAKKGHSVKSNEVSPVLLRLLRDEVLEREKNAEKQYEYRAK